MYVCKTTNKVKNLRYENHRENTGLGQVPNLHLTCRILRSVSCNPQVLIWTLPTAAASHQYSSGHAPTAVATIAAMHRSSRTATTALISNNKMVYAQKY